MTARQGIIPRQGVGGYDENWYPVVRSEDLAAGAVCGVDFFDGRVIVFRGENGKAAVTSAYCRHIGADLSVGEVVGNTIRCAFHAWQYDQAGHCCGMHAAGKIPQDADLYRFPTAEKFGLIWAFNGTEPHDALPSFSIADDALAFRAVELEHRFPNDPWVPITNSSDFQHLEVVHRLEVHVDKDSFAIGPHTLEYDVRFASAELGRVNQHVKVFGTNAITLENDLGGAVTMSLYTGTPLPDGTHRGFVVTATPRDPAMPEQQLAGILDSAESFFIGLIEEDAPVLSSIRFRRDRLVEADWALARYLKYVENYPRSHPSQDFIT